MSEPLDRALAKAQEAYRPRVRIPAAEWCPRFIRMPQVTSAIPGRWADDVFPYLRGVLEAYDDPEVEEIGLMWATQLAKSTLIAALLAYNADQQPGPAMVATANETSAKELSRTRLYPLLELCPRTQHLLLREKDRDTFLIDLRRMLVFFAWSGSVTRLGEKSVRYLFLTEVDKWSRQTTLEADPLALSLERTKAFPNCKIFREGTPTIHGISRIDAFIQTTDLRRYQLPCPHCGEHQALKKGQLKWPHGADGHSCSPEEARESAWYECEHCQGRIEDIHKPEMLRCGLWVSEGQSVTKKGKLKGKPARRSLRVGFHLTSLYSPLLTFGQVAEAWLRAQESPSQLQNFVNSWLAETWKGMDAAQDWLKVGERLSTDNPPGRVPEDAHFLTAGVDVQLYRLVYVIRAWGQHFTSWLIREGECETWADLEDLILKREFARLSKEDEALEVRLVGIDARFRTDEVYEFARRVGPRVRPVMGQASWRRPYSLTKIDVSPQTGKPIPGGVKLWHVDSGHYKEIVYHKMQMPAGEPGAFNLHQGVTEDYLQQLCGEKQEIRHDKATGREKYVWVVLDKTIGSHFLDAEAYAMAMADMLRVRQLDEAQGPRKPRERDAGESWLRPRRRRGGSWLRR